MDRFKVVYNPTTYTVMNKFMEKWMGELDELEVQVDLGMDELSAAFEKQKANMAEIVDDVQEKIKDKPSAASLRTKLDELRLQLALGKAESKDAYEAQKDKLEDALKHTHTALGEWSDEADEKLSGLSSTLKEKATQFETKMDLFKVQYALGKAEAKEEWEEKKSEIRDHIMGIRKKADEGKDKTEDKWDEFSDEMSEAFSHVKKAWKNIFD
ncbi:MAG: hypothetical protein AB8H47_25335 [Bacteroidia bacterium]